MSSIDTDTADETLFVPTEALEPAQPTRRRARRNPAWKASEDVSLYNGFEGLLVRTALLRSDRYEEAAKRAPKIESTQDTFQLCKHIGLLDREHIVTISLDSQLAVIAIHEASIGVESATMTTSQLLFRSALLCGANRVILAHNHPSGDARPSQDDIALTKAAVRAGKCYDIAVVDHIIITDKGYFSFVEHGLIE